ncbi:exodeoxyribonuclease VII large subunit [Oceanisphaera avium]|uniref:Exodeoxyribonuclease 7 large subunit n=1 Tax=Oceanisphaera avium TaxID=1903694 RepID=A0A1Y0CUV8_9GAMM|nr:exodeoxyribonuclease VII large subunit [Oceanisphaera avium]ART79039.1 exodeoxyribonuclease VII large subunit [Oceanisphaera avium]
MQQDTSNKVYTVSHLNRHARLLLEGELGSVAISGEISNLATPSSGHWYFSLKDSQSQLRCAMFKGSNRSVAFRPKNGDQVLLVGKVTLYEPRGDYQLVAQTMAPAGEGLLKQQYEALKQRLFEEGLFSELLKQALPAHPNKVGIISSPTGAALHDILSVLARRAPHLAVVIYPSQVQGEPAGAQLVQALATANQRNEVDILILARGGGSLEDLWCFNDERLVRAIAASHLPIVSAVGHEVDFTLSDFAADMRAPTPSAAAELISRDATVQQAQYQQWQQRLQQAQRRLLAAYQQQLSNLQARLQLQHPRQQLQQQAQQLDQLQARLQRAFRQCFTRAQQRLAHGQLRLGHQHPAQHLHNSQLALQALQQRLKNQMQTRLKQHEHQLALVGSRLNAISPLATLGRGYSITQQGSQVITAANQVQVGETLRTRVAEGEILSRVEQLLEVPTQKMATTKNDAASQSRKT